MNAILSRRKFLGEMGRWTAAVASGMVIGHAGLAAAAPVRPRIVRPTPVPVQPLPQIPGGPDLAWRQWVQQLMIHLKMKFQTVDMQVDFHGNRESCDIYFTVGGVPYICYVRGYRHQIVQRPFPRRPSRG